MSGIPRLPTLVSREAEASLLSFNELILAVELVPEATIYERLAAEYLLLISWALLILVAPLAEELLKVLTLKLIGGLTAQVF